MFHDEDEDGNQDTYNFLDVVGFTLFWFGLVALAVIFLSGDIV